MIRLDQRPVPASLSVLCASDYHLATPGLAALALPGQIYLDQRFSDHAPLIIDYDFNLWLPSELLNTRWRSKRSFT